MDQLSDEYYMTEDYLKDKADEAEDKAIMQLINSSSKIINGNLDIRSNLYKFIWSKTTGKSYHLNLKFLCGFNNHGYLFQCRKCNKLIYSNLKYKITYIIDIIINEGTFHLDGTYKIPECN